MCCLNTPVPQEELGPRALQKTLAKAGVADPKAAAQAVLAQRDDMLAQQEASSEPQVAAGSEREVRIGTIVFDEKADALGNGRFGFVFRCVDTKTSERLAVKRIEKLRFEAEGGKKEIEVLLHAQATDDGGHRNVIRYLSQLGNDHSVFIVMGLCDETLEARIQRKGFVGVEVRRAAASELCEGLGYLHGLPEAITHRDLKPSNVLFKGS